MDDYQLQELSYALLKEYKDLGAWNKLGQRQLVVYHDIGKGAHFHVQLDRTFAVDFAKPIGEAGKV
jgi:hypothetical protein